MAKLRGCGSAVSYSLATHETDTDVGINQGAGAVGLYSFKRAEDARTATPEGWSKVNL